MDRREAQRSSVMGQFDSSGSASWVSDRKAPGPAGIEHRLQRRLLVLSMPAHRLDHRVEQKPARDSSENLDRRRTADDYAASVSDRAVEDVPEPRLSSRLKVDASSHPRASIDVDLEFGVHRR